MVLESQKYKKKVTNALQSAHATIKIMLKRAKASLEEAK